MSISVRIRISISIITSMSISMRYQHLEALRFRICDASMVHHCIDPVIAWREGEKVERMIVWCERLKAET